MEDKQLEKLGKKYHKLKIFLNMVKNNNRFLYNSMQEIEDIKTLVCLSVKYSFQSDINTANLYIDYLIKKLVDILDVKL